jgi:dolichyl-phosphate-mannose--protein O-mannosyl transferase
MKPLTYRLGAAGVLALAAFLRLFELGFWRQLLFDENYYVKDAIALRLYGAEQVWPKDASSQIAAGTIPDALTQPELISHPPLGKLLISIGFDWFGPTNPLGWRITSAIAGIVLVAFTMAIAKLIFENSTLALLAGLFLAVDGTAVAMSRVAMLDGFLAMWVLVALWCYLRAHLGNHPVLWLLTSGLALGAATATKWSGLWFAVALVTHAVLRSRQRWAAFGWLAGGGIAAYLLTWLPWFTSSIGYDRSFAGNPLAAFIKLHVDMFNYNLHYHSSNPSVASAWGWPILWQPTIFAVDPHSHASAACAVATGCKLMVTTLGNPLIWWVGTIAVLVLLWARIRGAETRSSLILLLAGAAWLPWHFTDRSTFQFYAVVLAPFWCIALAWLVAKLPLRRAAIFAATAVLVSFAFLPYQLGTAQPDWYWQITRWMPLWQ